MHGKGRASNLSGSRGPGLRLALSIAPGMKAEEAVENDQAEIDRIAKRPPIVNIEENVPELEMPSSQPPPSASKAPQAKVLVRFRDGAARLEAKEKAANSQ